MPPFALLSPKVWGEIVVAVIIAAACWYAYNWVYDRGAASIQVKWDAETLEETKQSAKIAADALATTKSLQEGANNEQKAKNAQIASLNAKLGVAIAGLSNRPSRDSSGSLPHNPATGTTVGATGADLPRQDAAFLIGESTRFDRLRLDLIECQNRYGQAADKLK